MTRFLCGMALVIVCTPAVPGAEPADIATLFPVNPVVYVEVTQPETVARDLALLCKGSTLDNPLAFFQRQLRNWHAGELVDRSEAGILTTWLSPVMLQEAKHFQGLALALTGFDSKGNPSFVAVLRPGKSTLPGTLIRAFLAGHPHVKKVNTVGGIDIFQEWNQSLVLDMDERRGDSSAILPTPRFALAHSKELILFGSDQELLKAVIQRWQGQDKSPNFTTAAAFSEIIQGRKQPDLLVHLQAQELANQVERHLRVGHAITPTAWVACKNLLPLAHIKSVTGHISLANGKIRTTLQMQFVMGKISPLFDFFTGQTVAVDQLQGLPSAGSFALTVGLPQGTQRLTKSLNLLDTLVKATGSLGPTPSEIMQEIAEKKPQIDPYAIFGKVNGLTLLLPATSTVPEKETLPTVVLDTEDSAAAEALETLLPAVSDVLGTPSLQPVTETLQGQKIRSLAARNSPTGSTLHYGRAGKRFAIGGERQIVALALKSSKNEQISVEDATDFATKALVGRVQWAEWFKTPPMKTIKRFGPRDLRYDHMSRDMFFERSNGRIADKPAGALRLVEQLQTLPPLWLTLRRGDNRLYVEAVQAPPTKGFASLVDQGLYLFAQWSTLRESRQEFTATDDLTLPAVGPQGIAPPLLPPGGGGPTP